MKEGLKLNSPNISKSHHLSDAQREVSQWRVEQQNIGNNQIYALLEVVQSHKTPKERLTALVRGLAIIVKHHTLASPKQVASLEHLTNKLTNKPDWLAIMFEEATSHSNRK